MTKFIVLYSQGLENLVINEIKELGPLNVIKIFKGIIIFEFEDKDRLLNLKTVDDILIFVKKLAGISRYRTSLRNIRHQILKSKFKPKIKTFSVKVSYIGRRDYKASEVEEVVAEELIKKYGWKHTKKFGDIHINVILRTKISLIGICLDNKPFHVKRKLKTVPGSLKNSVACAMLKLADVKKRDIVLDPMCGSGVIAIEADKLGVKVIAGDIDKKVIEIAKQNSKKIDFKIWDALKTGLPVYYVDKVICNLPFGKQVKLADKEVFFENFIKEMLRISKDNFIWVFLTRQENIFRNIINKFGLKLEKNLKIVNSGLESELMVIKKQ